MKKQTKIILVVLGLTLLSSCSILRNMRHYRETTASFVNFLIEENFDKAIELFTLKHKSTKYKDEAELKSQLEVLSSFIVENFGTEIEYLNYSAQKNPSLFSGGGTRRGTTSFAVVFHNRQDLCTLSLIFEDKSGKIISFDHGEKEPLSKEFLPDNKPQGPNIINRSVES